MKTLKNITVLPGDGIGPEVVKQAMKVLDAVAVKYNHTWNIQHGLIGACAIDKTGDPYPQETQDVCNAADAILLGAIGDPRYDNDPSAKVRPEQGLLRMRKSLGLYANIRPIKMYPSLARLSVLKEHLLEGVDFVIYRELTGGIYFGEKKRTGDDAYDICSYSKHEVERISKMAFEEAMKRRKKLHLIDKANVLETSRLWREVVMQMSKEYPDVKVEYMFVDNAAMQIIVNPASFDVMLCENMFGDILSDESSVLAGSLGLLPSSSKGDGCFLYEPIHGSYPQAAGKDIANPLATVLSVEMMLRDFNYTKEADEIIAAVDFCMERNILTQDLKPEVSYSCSQIGEVLSLLIAEGTASPKLKALLEERAVKMI